MKETKKEPNQKMKTNKKKKKEKKSSFKLRSFQQLNRNSTKSQGSDNASFHKFRVNFH